MATGQNYTTGSLGADTSLPYLTSWFRQVAQPLMRFRNLCDIKEAIGTRKGNTFSWDIVANVGTGTPVLFVSYSNHYHVAGTGLGGGTIAGLSKLLLHATPQQTEKLALRGSSSLDLSVKDIVGSGIGVVPASATASNFAKAALLPKSKIRKQDLAFAIVNSVAEPIAVIAVLAARERSCADRIFFTGRVSQNKLFQKRAGATVAMFGGKAFFPRRGEYATAIGAALS